MWLIKTLNDNSGVCLFNTLSDHTYVINLKTLEQKLASNHQHHLINPDKSLHDIEYARLLVEYSNILNELDT